MPRQPPSFLGVEKVDPYGVRRNILEVPAEGASSAGISYLSSKGAVPYAEQHRARIRAGVTLKEWFSMHYFERALIVANFRIENAERSHREAHAIEEARKNTPRPKKRGLR
jgi:hypothetical protein